MTLNDILLLLLQNILGGGGQKDSIAAGDETKYNITILEGISIIHRMYCRYTYTLPGILKCQEKHDHAFLY